MQDKELLKGNLQTIVLKLLFDNHKMYGYEITQKVKELSDNELVLTEGALYPTLHKLKTEGLVKTESVYNGKRVRKYYSLTPTGTSTVRDKIEEFIAFVNLMKQVLQINFKVT